MIERKIKNLLKQGMVYVGVPLIGLVIGLYSVTKLHKHEAEFSKKLTEIGGYKVYEQFVVEREGFYPIEIHFIPKGVDDRDYKMVNFYIGDCEYPKYKVAVKKTEEEKKRELEEIRRIIDNIPEEPW